jgi:hypothetical protein
MIAFGPSGIAADNGDCTGFSWRIHCGTLAAGGSQIRVRIKAGSGGSGAIVSHWSIGIGTGTGSNTTATPTELKVGGANGFTLAASAEAYSDWLAFPTVKGQVPIVIFDEGAGSHPSSGGAGFTRYFIFTTPQYNVSSPTGLSGPDANGHYVRHIEVR